MKPVLSKIKKKKKKGGGGGTLTRGEKIMFISFKRTEETFFKAETARLGLR